MEAGKDKRDERINNADVSIIFFKSSVYNMLCWQLFSLGDLSMSQVFHIIWVPRTPGRRNALDFLHGVYFDF
jgi:hypothetical protein